MDKTTTATILGTILGLAAGVAGMVFFGPAADHSDDVAELEERMIDLTRERNETRDALKQAEKLADDAEAERDRQIKISNELSDELRRKGEATGAEADKIEELQKGLDELKRETDERLRLKNARIDKLEGLLEDNGILEHLSDEEIQARIENLNGSFDTAFTNRDKKAAMEALWDMQKLGPRAYDTTIEAWRRLAEDFGLAPWGEGPGEMDMNMQEFVSLIGNFGLIEHGLTDQDVDPAFRINSIYALPWWNGEAPGKRARLAGDVLSRGEGYELEAAVGALRDINDPTTARYLSDFLLQDSSNPGARSLAVTVLAAKNTPGGWATIEDIAESDPDESVRQAARQALAQRDAEVAGILITQVIEDYQAALAGIKLGDILTHYNGVRVKSLSDVNNAKGEVEPGQSVEVIVRRGGEDVTLTVGEGTIGINGVSVTPKD